MVCNKIKLSLSNEIIRELIEIFQNSNGEFLSLIVVMSKKYRVDKSTSGLVVKIQNGRRKLVFRR